MKALHECKVYFQDVFISWLEDKEKAETDGFYNLTIGRYEGLCNSLKFIYGEEFEKVSPTWRKEALDEFYSSKQNEFWKGGNHGKDHKI